MDKNNFQDWETVILRKPIQISNKSNKKQINNRTNNQKKLEGDEIVKPKKIDLNLKQSIQNARINKKLSQKQLASQMGVNVQIINSYETGKAIPNNNFISKIEKILNTKLPRVKN